MSGAYMLKATNVLPHGIQQKQWHCLHGLGKKNVTLGKKGSILINSFKKVAFW